MQALLPFLLAPALLAAPAHLETRIEEALNSSAGASRAFWGVHVVSLDSGETLYARNHHRFFIPASNTKLFSTALALARLGPDYRFRTTVRADALPDAEGRLAGDLRLVGGADPTMSARLIPYRNSGNSGNPLQAIEDLAGQIAARGVRTIAGDIVGDDTHFVWDPYPDGWTMDDSLWEYGAPVSALPINDSALSLFVRPGSKPGEPATLRVSPPLPYYELENYVRTVKTGTQEISIFRPPGLRRLQVWGNILTPGSETTLLVAIDDPALYAAYALRDALQRRGITVLGSPVARHLYPHQVPDLKQAAPPVPAPDVELAVRVSPPLLETLRVINKVSQNLQAELVLREVALVRRHIGSLPAALEEMRTFLLEAGIEEQDYHFQDGSGLSRRTLVSPHAVSTLLRHMYCRGYGEVFASLLPVAGVDGTLSTRFPASAEAPRIRAKTGTLSHVSALSGYALSKSGERRVFSIMVNNYNAPSYEIRSIIDKIGLILLD